MLKSFDIKICSEVNAIVSYSSQHTVLYLPSSSRRALDRVDYLVRIHALNFDPRITRETTLRQFRIIEGPDNRGPDNQGSTVQANIVIRIVNTSVNF